MWAPEDACSELPIIDRIEDSEKLLAQIVECIEQRDSRGVKTYILEHKLKKEAIFWDLILKLGDCITAEVCEEDPAFFDVCSRCLHYIVKVGNAKETLLALLEQVDTFIDDVKFKNFLLYIQTALLRIPKKLFHSLDITLESVSSHLRSLPLPENTQLEGDEIKVFHVDKTVVRLADILDAYLTFLEPFVNAVDLIFENRTEAAQQEALVLKKHLVRLFDVPLCYLILTYNPETDKTKSNSRICAELTMTLFAKIETDFHRLIKNAKTQVKESEFGDKAGGSLPNKGTGQEDIDNQENDKKLADKNTDAAKEALDIVESWDFCMEISPLAQACLAYLLYVENLGIEKLPAVYRHDYTLDFHLDLISLLLQNTSYPINYKGLLLCQALVRHVSNYSICADYLDNPAYMTILNDLIHIMIKCPVRDHRTLATTIFPNFINKFDVSGRYQIYLSVLTSCDHSGLKGYLITLFKNDLNRHISIAKSSSSNQPASNASNNSTGPNIKESDDDASKCFTGKKLFKLLSLALMLPEKETTDMLENSDQIISSLNLLRFLILADPAATNITGFWDFLPSIEQDFTSPLRLGLDMSKAHYQLELDNIRQGKDTMLGADKGPDVSVSLQGMNLPAMEKKEKMELIEKAINTHYIMHSLLCRVTELMDQQKSIINK